MPHPLDQVAAQLAALVALTGRLTAAAPEDRALILDDAVRATGGRTHTLAEDYPAIYEFHIHGVTAAGLDRDSAADTWLNLADHHLSGGVLDWAEVIVRCPVPGIPFHRLLQAAQTVLSGSVDPQARYAAEQVQDAAEQKAFPEQCAA